MVYVANRSSANGRAGRARPSTTPCSGSGGGPGRHLLHLTAHRTARDPRPRRPGQPLCLLQPPIQRSHRSTVAHRVPQGGRQGRPRQAQYPWRGHLSVSRGRGMCSTAPLSRGRSSSRPDGHRGLLSVCPARRSLQRPDPLDLRNAESSLCRISSCIARCLTAPGRTRRPASGDTALLLKADRAYPLVDGGLRGAVAGLALGAVFGGNGTAIEPAPTPSPSASPPAPDTRSRSGSSPATASSSPRSEAGGLDQRLAPLLAYHHSAGLPVRRSTRSLMPLTRVRALDQPDPAHPVRRAVPGGLLASMRPADQGRRCRPRAERTGQSAAPRGFPSTTNTGIPVQVWVAVLPRRGDATRCTSAGADLRRAHRRPRCWVSIPAGACPISRRI